MAAIAQSFFNIHGLFLWALDFLLFGLLVTCGAIYVREHPTRQGETGAAKAVQALSPQAGVLTTQLPNFRFDDYFRLAHASQLTEQTAHDIGVLVAQQHPNDQQETLLRFIGMGYWGYSHEITWRIIYRSQILALAELNAKGGYLPIAAIRAHYDTAAAQNQNLYQRYTFEQWMEFMFERLLILKRPADVIEITVQGRDFLKFLTHYGWTADQRIN